MFKTNKSHRLTYSWKWLRNHLVKFLSRTLNLIDSMFLTSQDTCTVGILISTFSSLIVLKKFPFLLSRLRLPVTFTFSPTSDMKNHTHRSNSNESASDVRRWLLNCAHTPIPWLQLLFMWSSLNAIIDWLLSSDFIPTCQFYLSVTFRTEYSAPRYDSHREKELLFFKTLYFYSVKTASYFISFFGSYKVHFTQCLKTTISLL